MIRKIHIENYKSIYNLDIEVGRINVFIGENGSGKTNILEALAFVAAAQTDKLDNEFLANRGIRITSPELTRSRFDDESIDKPIKIELYLDNNRKLNYVLDHDNKSYSKWKKTISNLALSSKLDEIVKELLKRNGRKLSKTARESLLDKLEKYKEELQYEKLNNFIIYSPENTALRNFYKEGQIEPLGVNGEGLLKLVKNCGWYKFIGHSLPH